MKTAAALLMCLGLGILAAPAQAQRPLTLKQARLRAVYNDRLAHWDLQMRPGRRWTPDGGHRIYALSEAKVASALGIALKPGEQLLFMRNNTQVSAFPKPIRERLVQAKDVVAAVREAEVGLASHDSGLIFKAQVPKGGKSPLTQGELVGVFGSGHTDVLVPMSGAPLRGKFR
jgi:hypothetical protein